MILLFINQKLDSFYLKGPMIHKGTLEKIEKYNPRMSGKVHLGKPFKFST